jgi:hypothetical protein
MKRIPVPVLLVSLLAPAGAWAHHGGISLAAGPGSPIETSSPLTLPQGAFILSVRAEQVAFRKFSFAEPENKTSNTFTNLGLSYGIAPYLTGSIFVPYTFKRQDGFETENGFGDPRIQLSVGFNHKPGQGVSLNRADDTAVSMEGSKTTYFGAWIAGTVPAGKYENIRDGETEPDKGMQTGFGSPSFEFGAAVSRNLAGSFSLTADATYAVFLKKSNTAGPNLQDSWKYGNEFRLDLAGTVELYGKPDAFLSKVDGVLELNFLQIARDELNGTGEAAAGGKILYLTPGARFSLPILGNANLGLAVKFPVWKDLNEQDQQQGSEGLEKFRAIGTLSFFF